MDVQIFDENTTSCVIIQDYELQELLEFAEKWTEISNHTERVRKVRKIIWMIREQINKWQWIEKGKKPVLPIACD